MRGFISELSILFPLIYVSVFMLIAYCFKSYSFVMFTESYGYILFTFISYTWSMLHEMILFSSPIISTWVAILIEQLL